RQAWHFRGYSRRTLMIVVTGGAGFIGSNLVRGLNRRGYTNILVVDDLTEDDKSRNLVGGEIADHQHKDDFRLRVKHGDFGVVWALLHPGSCAASTEGNGHRMLDNNYQVTLGLLELCHARRAPFMSASSPAV